MDDYRALVTQALQDRKEIYQSTHNGWSIICYSGHIPDPDNQNIVQIEFSAYARTGDLEKSQTPDLSVDPRAIRVDFDDTSIVTLSAQSKQLLADKLQKIFNGFEWS